MRFPLSRTSTRRWSVFLSTAVVALAGLGTLAPAPAMAKVDHWRTVQPAHVARGFHTSTLLRDGRVLAAGGFGASGHLTASAEIYNPAKNRWRRTRPMAHARAGHQAVRLESGRVLVIGGGAAPEMYAPRLGQWRAVAAPHHGNGASTATLLKDGRVFVFNTGGDCSGVPEIYTPWTNRWRDGAAIDESVVPCGGKSVLLHDGRVLMHGGENNQGAGFTGTYIYNPRTNSWSRPGPSDPPDQETFLHMDQALTVLSTGQVLLAGGTCRLCTGSERFTLLFTPAANRWVETGDFNVGREGNVLVSLGNGRALAAGGFAMNFSDPNPQPQPRSAEVYDAHTGAWTRTSDMHNDHQSQGMTATRLKDGRVLVLGGANINAPSATAFAEVFVP
jgi:N-acetylneuraminic acid mutarotase